MPTRRAAVILILAGALYLIANQTQVGWVYLMTDALLGLLLVSFLYAWGLLGGLRGARHCQAISPTETDIVAAPPADPLQMPDLFEDDPLQVTLALEQTGWRPALLVGGNELCPVAPPGQQRQPFFAPSLFRCQPLYFQYHTTCDRRGVYTFPPLQLRSDGPFGLFRRRRTLAVPTDLLILPRYHPLKRLRLLENRGFTDRHAARSGHSSEVVGTREYRAGDSLRTIHWRSTARTGRLVVKEFADSDHLTLAVALDLAAAGSENSGKFSTFETAVRLAASLGYYATHHNIPFRLLGRSEQWQPPAIALSWWGVLHYLARVQNDGVTPLAAVLRDLPPVPFAVVLVSQPTPAIYSELAALPKRGTFCLALFITPDGSLPAPAQALTAPNLATAAAGPHNWADVLQTM